MLCNVMEILFPRRSMKWSGSPVPIVNAAGSSADGGVFLGREILMSRSGKRITASWNLTWSAVRKPMSVLNPRAVDWPSVMV